MREKKAKKLLDHVKATYDNIAEEFSETRNYTGKEFDSFLPYLKNGVKIVDLGCGNGRFAGYIDQKDIHCDYLGIDNSKKFVSIAHKKYPKHHFIQGDQLHIPVGEKCADVLLNIRAFHHIPSRELRLDALFEMQRILKPDGTLIISVWDLWQTKYWKQLLMGILRAIFTLGSYACNDTFISWNNREKRYYHAFTQGELEKLIKKSGFSIQETNKIGKDFIVIAKK